jgi:dihydroorotate dehydrogenase electron transfer subunit
MTRILEVRAEAHEIATLRLAAAMRIQPGQFVMLWIPGMDEKPYAVSKIAPDEIEITIRKRGVFSSRLIEMKAGESLGVRGPYGRGYRPRPRGILVAGGCGLATVAPLKEMLPDAPLLLGAKTKSELFFLKRFPDMRLCTDDGSAGERCFPTELLRPYLERGEADVVYTCGPEVMMRAVFALCEEFAVECQVCLERYMKCGFGICGQCTCGDRLVCLDGPVFLSDDLRRMTEFGKTARLKSGRSVSIQEYADWRSC